MRTYEDVKIALKKYHDELANEASSKQSHWIVIGGNMCIVKKGASTQYILGKGDPVPMIKATAEANLSKFQARCGDNIELKMVEYTSWLNEEIKECEHLISCMQKTLAGEEPSSSDGVVSTTIVSQQPICSNAERRAIHVCCEECPYKINSCWTCKYAGGVDTSVIPWMILCMAPQDDKEDKVNSE